jgi:uncharacterized protein YecE (DUF72 family)
MSTIYIGTSGYAYLEWKGGFYPAGLRGKGMLPYYTEYFCTVEINNTFYRMPSENTMREWYRIVPDNFRFSIKARQLITVSQDFGLSDGYTQTFMERITLLGNRLGTVLFQFPPDVKDLGRIQDFVDRLLPILKTSFIPVIEVRSKELWHDNLFKLLSTAKLGLCMSDQYIPFEEWPPPWTVAYLRLRHAPYSKEILRRLASKLKRWREHGLDVYVYFKHETMAPALAVEFMKLIGEE